MVREVLLARACSSGALRWHAGAVAYPGGAVLVLGGAGSGKSSTVAQLLAAGAGFVGNDRVLLHVTDRQQARLYGVPLAIRWTPAQMRLFPGGAELMRDYDTVSSLRRQDSLAGHPKYEVTPAELGRLTGCPAVPDAPLTGVVVVDRSRTTGCASVKPLDAATGAAELHAAWLRSDPAFPPSSSPARCGRARSPPRPAEDVLAEVRWCRLTATHGDTAAIPALLDHLGLSPAPQESHR